MGVDSATPDAPASPFVGLDALSELLDAGIAATLTTVVVSTTTSRALSSMLIDTVSPAFSDALSLVSTTRVPVITTAPTSWA